MSKSSGSRTSRKAHTRPKKPYAEFPLYPHPLGYWSKKVDGKIRHFGRWGRVVNGVVTRVENEEAGWRDALKVYKDRIDDVKAGEVGHSPVVGEKEAPAVGFAVKDLCNQFRAAKLRQKENGELTPRMFAEYELMTTMVYKQFGSGTLVDALKPEHFAKLRETMAKRWGALRLLNGITRVKTIFKFAFEAGWIDRLPRYGSEFKPPSQLQLRKNKAKAPPRMAEPDELRRLLDAADVQLRAMIYLGLNCGFGNHDCAALPLSAVNLDTAWVEFPRPKTGIHRKCPLWPETVTAIREAIEKRPKPTDYDACGLVFLNYRGTAWVRMGEKSRSDYLSIHFNALAKRLKLQRAGLSFYSLRHVFRTVADAAKDIPAVRSIMGHVDTGIDATYRERIDDERLTAVVDHVHKWLWPKTADQSKTEEPKASEQVAH